MPQCMDQTDAYCRHIRTIDLQGKQNCNLIVQRKEVQPSLIQCQSHNSYRMNYDILNYQ